MNAHYAKSADLPNRGEPKWVYWKYRVFAQFSRFLREGYQVIGTSDDSSVAAYDAEGKRPILITVGYDTPQKIHYDLGSPATVGEKAAVTFTRTDGKALFSKTSVPVTGRKFTIDAAAKAVYSIVVDGVVP